MTVDAALNGAEHDVAGHAIPAGALATDPPPLPARATLTGYVTRTKLAVAVAAAFKTNEQDAPLHALLQPVNEETASGDAFNTTAWREGSRVGAATIPPRRKGTER